MTQANPFQTPAASLSGPATTPATPVPFDEEALAFARQRLAAHCADTVAVAADRALEGGRITLKTYVAAGISGLLFLGAAAGIFTNNEGLVIFSGILMGVTLTVFLLYLITDIRVGPRVKAITATDALQWWFRAARGGRAGYAVVSLAPTARERPATAPSYAPNDPPGAQFSVGDVAGMKEYLGSFARQGGGFVRWTLVRKVRLVEVQDDVAIVEAQLTLSKWPQWAQMVSIAAFVVIRAIGVILMIVLYYSLRKVKPLTIRKTLMKGPDGLWYLLDANLER